MQDQKRRRAGQWPIIANHQSSIILMIGHWPLVFRMARCSTVGCNESKLVARSWARSAETTDFNYNLLGSIHIPLLNNYALIRYHFFFRTRPNILEGGDQGRWVSTFHLRGCRRLVLHVRARYCTSISGESQRSQEAREGASCSQVSWWRGEGELRSDSFKTYYIEI